MFIVKHTFDNLKREIEELTRSVQEELEFFKFESLEDFQDFAEAIISLTTSQVKGMVAEVSWKFLPDSQTQKSLQVLPATHRVACERAATKVASHS